MPTDAPVIAAIVPCHNEEAAISQVVHDLFDTVPGIQVYVYDNLSTDATVEVARAAGAEVRFENNKGKGNVVRRAFADIDADVYLLIDGDDTYDVSAAPAMIEALLDGPYDHVLGVRKQVTSTAYRPGHSAGNRAFNRLVSGIFKSEVNDMLSGYRVFSRRFVKSFPAISREFEVETELTVHSMSLRVPQTEIEVGFKDRPEGSESKLNTYRDGFKILSLIFELTRHERPLMFHGIVGALFAIAALVLGIPVIVEFVQTGLVPRFPTALLAASLAIVSALILLIGFVLDGTTRARREVARLVYLGFAAPSRSTSRLSE
ncbi:glycosyltransferase [Herbiconiux ginsengi]|uniref:Glycosyltransferase involved in cell wall bisynthesis n=1 Tax=Herbiconiux ginsengi TaxID=381665 RepID=A0A1H3STR4_9MICO|nr:glycosyltransferase [Herbiconiux ginsengi]SDZ41376.1 Glycosyltransferase involved in cell wall bisynthesis [Herbiconiux ginsengi]